MMCFILCSFGKCFPIWVRSIKKNLIERFKAHFIIAEERVENVFASFDHRYLHSENEILRFEDDFSFF
jgi:hypothetical protein